MTNLTEYFDGLDGWLRATLVVLGAIVAAKLADWTVTRLLKRWAEGTRTTVDDQVIALLHRPVVWSIVLLGARAALPHVGFTPEQMAPLTRALQTVVVILWFAFFLRTAGTLLESAARQPRVTVVESRTLPLFENVAKIAVFALAVYALIAIWGADPGPWIASAGIAGIAIGLAAQDTLSNFFAGISIIADAPYRVGDYVNLADGQRGQVVRIGLRSTRILTRDDIEITIPNSVIGGNAIVNESAGPSSKHRVRVQVGVAYRSDLDLVRRTLLDVASHEGQVCDDPEPRVRFRSFGESGLDLELLCWIPEPGLRGRVLDSLNTAVYHRFAEAGVEIPYPKRDLYVKELPGSPTAGADAAGD